MNHGDAGLPFSVFSSLWENDFGTTKGSSQCNFVFDYMTCVALNSGDADFLSSNYSQQCGLIKVLAQLIRFNFVFFFFL